MSSQDNIEQKAKFVEIDKTSIANYFIYNILSSDLEDALKYALDSKEEQVFILISIIK